MALNLTDLSAETIMDMAEKIKTGQLLQKLRHEHEMLSIRSEIEGIENKEELERLNSEILSLEENTKGSKDDSSLLTEIYPKQSQIKIRLEKLEKRREDIQKEVYDSLKDEYQSELTILSEQLNSIIKQLEISRQQIQPLIQVLNFQIEELTVRKEIEDLSDDLFETKMSKLQTELTEKEKYLSAVEYLLKQVRP